LKKNRAAKKAQSQKALTAETAQKEAKEDQKKQQLISGTVRQILPGRGFVLAYGSSDCVIIGSPDEKTLAEGDAYYATVVDSGVIRINEVYVHAPCIFLLGGVRGRLHLVKRKRA
jgi:hypothetical protein